MNRLPLDERYFKKCALCFPNTETAGLLHHYSKNVRCLYANAIDKKYMLKYKKNV